MGYECYNLLPKSFKPFVNFLATSKWAGSQKNVDAFDFIEEKKGQQFRT